MDHRSKIPNIETLLGKALALKIRMFEKARLRVSKMKYDLTFLKRCRDCSLVPLFARIKHPLRSSKNPFCVKNPFDGRIYAIRSIFQNSADCLNILPVFLRLSMAPIAELMVVKLVLCDLSS